MDHGTTVGLPARIDGLVLPGPELEVKPLADRKSPIVLRIVNVWPHGSSFRYDFEYYGLEAGKFDLREYLRRTGGATAADLPAIPVEIQSVLPPGQIKPSELRPNAAPRLGGYRLGIIVGSVLWLLGLIALLLIGRRRRVEEQAAGKPRTLADHLRPLVEGARAGRLSAAQLAELERSLLIYWERRLHLEELKPADAIAKLRAHPDAGPLLRHLESWLHQPGAANGVDVAALLEPYQNIPAESAELEAPAR